MRSIMNQLMDPKAAITAARERFISLAQSKNMDWKEESLYAIQMVKRNDYLERVAISNPWSLTMAMANVAGIGLTLNPARGLAYLVPRDGEAILDISYRGLVELGVLDGGIQWAKAEIVREKDCFVYEGPTREPEHKFNPFDKDRGLIIGAYCIARLQPEGIMVEAMPIDEVWQVRDMSPAYQKGKGPWMHFEGEMIKKVVIKRASKSWPRTPQLDNAVRYLNEELDEGIIETTQDQVVATQEKDIPDQEIPGQVRDYVQRVIIRAKATGLWDNALDLVNDRYSGQIRSWAIRTIKSEQPVKEAVGQ